MLLKIVDHELYTGTSYGISYDDDPQYLCAGYDTLADLVQDRIENPYSDDTPRKLYKITIEEV